MIPQLSMQATGLFAARARATSLNVPQFPPTAMTASLLFTTRAFLASPMPVGTATVNH
jgi:hypothetical protein